MSDGLSPGSINSFFKDSNGFFWIGTSSGLNRYDGYEIRTFNPKAADNSQVYPKNYDKIFEDPLGNIWTQTFSGMKIFNTETEQFSYRPAQILKKLGLPEKEVLYIKKDSEGDFWFILEGEEIFKYSLPGRKAEEVPFSNNEPGNSVTDFQEGNNNNFWIIYQDGTIKNLDKRTMSITGEYPLLAKKFNNQIKDYRLTVDQDNDLWIHLFEDHGVFYYKPEMDSLRNFNSSTSKIRLSSDLISDIVMDPEGNLWIATDHGGITLINKENWNTTYISNNPEIENSLSHNSITSLYKDDDGIIWAGTFKSGVDYFHKNSIRFQHHENLFSQSNSLPFNDVNVFEEDQDGNIWIGTNGGGLIFLNRKTHEYKQFKHKEKDSSSISSNIIVSLYHDHKGDLWVGTYLGGLNKLNHTEGTTTFTRFTHNEENPYSLGGKSVWEIFEDSRGILWIGTLVSGLEIFDRESERFYHSGNTSMIPNLHNNSYISSITEDVKGNIWIGGVSGIDIFNPENGKREHFDSHTNGNKALPTDYIISLFRGSDDNMWIGTEKGLSLYNPDRKSFTNFSEEEGLPGKNVLAITEDNQEDLWLSSSYGLFQMKKKYASEDSVRIKPTFSKYDDQDGLQGNLFNQNALFKNSRGEILAGGLNGFNLFNPEDFNFNENPPKVVFTSLYLFNQRVRPGEKINDRVILKKAITETPSITLNHNENLFSLEFAALDFFQPSKNNYQYKLEGFDEEWQGSRSDNRRVTYTNLDPGDYTFMVRASNNDQVWSDSPATLNIEILPPFYKTTYAYIFYVLVIALILFISRQRIIRRQQEKFRIEQEKREAAQLHKMDLMKIRFFTNISHEFKTPLSLILAVIDKLKFKETASEKKEQLETVNKNTQRLFNLINQILDLGNIEKEKLLFTSQGNLIEFLEKTFNSFQSLAARKDITYTFKTNTDNFYTAFDQDKLEKILFNLLSNAFKFTGTEGKILMDCRICGNTKKDEKTLKIKIKDSGIGIPEEDQKHIFDRFYKVEGTKSNSSSGSGIGLSLVKEFVELYKGKIEVQSKPEEGTMFIVSLPFPVLKENIPEKPEDEVSSKERIVAQENNPAVLIIEDDVDFLNFLTGEFKAFYNVFIATNGEEGWKKTLSVKPDIIISDWIMPKMDGISLCEKIRKDPRTRHIPFILLTANKKDQEKLQALKIGVNDFISKPFNLDVLLSRTGNLIEQRRAFQQAYSKKIKLEKEQQPVISQDDKFVQQALQIVDRHLGDPEFSVESLASQLGVSRTYLYNKLKTKTEKSPQEFIKDTRLNRGKHLLENSKMTISEIAYEVGFNNPKYFTKNFKKKFKKLPSEIRAEVSYS
ncbi:hybrid sensor histidine kinase/response regulator transcription factor [Autumnicola musiva]|uniref:histidine kinase n=1 Tax=Autumnicola musiva TaxID=3075589 RepID=A0ABU3D165_9FLAO|nr:two-component regulator propeller domain-containing protein [Zunongwangia sp. F117]MDT0675257.1 two-component regulator propeller domain-containing protein [Zunongwangia sp. F117]